MPAVYEELEARVGYTFKDRALLLKALTHKSVHSDAAADRPRFRTTNNWSFWATRFWALWPASSSCAVVRIVPRGSCPRAQGPACQCQPPFQVATELSLGEYLQTRPWRGAERGRAKKAILANALRSPDLPPFTLTADWSQAAVSWSL